MLESVVEGLKLVGGISGLTALAWKLYETFGSYLQLDLEVASDATMVAALATVTNKGVTVKTLDYAFLLVGPEAESPVETANRIATSLGGDTPTLPRFAHTNDIARIRQLIADDNPRYVDGRALIPLPFFFSEQVDIGDEILKYRSTIDVDRFRPGAYSVRFFVFPRDRLLRCTQDLFVRAVTVDRHALT